MADIYIDNQLATVQDGIIDEYLPHSLPMDVEIALDTETCGLFVDGDWNSDPSKCSPPARVSVVSLAWREPEHDTEMCKNCFAWSVGMPQYSEPDHHPDCLRADGRVLGRIRTLALPFDQGWIGGKLGTWNPAADTFFVLPHTEECQAWRDQGLGNLTCWCAQHNLDSAAWIELCKWLQDRPLVMHHKKFDTHIMRAGQREAIRCHNEYDSAFCYCRGINLADQVVWDTMLVQGILAPLESSSLKPTMQRLFGETEGDQKKRVEKALSKQGKGLTKRYDLLDWTIIGPYAAKDAEQTLRLREHQKALIDEGHVEFTDMKIIDIEFRLSKLLFEMECRGVGFNVDQMREEADKMRKAVADLKAQLPFKPPSINAAKTYFFGQPPTGLGLLPIKTTATCVKCGYNMVKHIPSTAKKYADVPRCRIHEGGVSLDGEVVARLAADKVPGAEEWKEIANNESAINKWYRGWPYKAGVDGRIRTSFRQGRIESDRKGANSGGAISGRLSAERIQLQGVPKEWRIPKGILPVEKMFDAKPGYQDWNLDLSNAEVRVSAWLSRCRALADRINTGENIHDSNTKLIFGVDEDDPMWEWYRTSAKRGIFGRLYGAGIRTLKTQIDADLKADVPEIQIRKFLDMLDSTYPELARTSRQCQRKADRTMGGCGYVRLVNGRKRIFGWGERTHKAFNAAIQGGVAEVMKVWMLAADAAHPNIIINQVHDSIWIEVPEAHAESIVDDIATMGERIFEQHFSTEEIPITFKVDKKRFA